jgi:hypothetical protein
VTRAFSIHLMISQLRALVDCVSMSAKAEIPVGRKFGELTIIGRAPNRKGATGAFVFTKCDCGTESRMTLRSIVRRGVSRCNRESHWDRSVVASGESMIGQRYGALTVIAATAERHVSPGGSRSAQVLTRCECGVERYARISDLRGGSVQSCGGDAHKVIAKQVKRWTVSGKRGTYAIEAIGTGMVKIGSSRDFKTRMWKLQPACPVELRMIASTPDDIEKRLHVELDAHRLHGEWFSMNDDVMAAIGKSMAPADLSVMAEFSASRSGRAKAGRHRCKRCGDLGHHAKTCSRGWAKRKMDAFLGSRHRDHGGGHT